MAKKAAEAPPEEIPDEAPEVQPSAETVAPSDNRFFGWMRGLGIDRQPGWIGGVCAGIAARLGVDPLIVRGILVVVAVLGGPALLFYAAAWLLLPDTNNKIHLEELIAGRFESPIAGIGALVLLSLLPLTQGFWYAGAAYWGAPEWGQSLGRTLWTVGLLVAIVWFVVWIARRSNAPRATPDATPPSPRPSARPAGAATTAAFVAAAPAHPAHGAPQEEIAEWRAKQEAWKAEREAFRLERAATEQEARRQRAEESKARAIEAGAQRAEANRRYLLAHPRAGAAFGAIALGAAAVAGGVAAVIASGIPQQADYRVTIALAVAALFIAAAIIGAGLFGRRTGFLNFVAFVVITASVLTAAIPSDRILVPTLGSYGLSNAVPGRYLVLGGNLDITIADELPGNGGVIDIWQATGTTSIWLDENTTTRVEIVSATGDVSVARNGEMLDGYTRLDTQTLTDDFWRSTTTFGDGATPDAIVRIWQARGSISILVPPTEPTPTEEQE